MNMILGFSLQNSIKKRYTKLAKFDISPPPTRYHLRKCAYFIKTCTISGYLNGHVCDGWYSDPLCRTLCRYVGSKKCFMVPLSLIIIIPKLILSTNLFFFRIGFLRKLGRSGYQKRRIKKVHPYREKIWCTKHKTPASISPHSFENR